MPGSERLFKGVVQDGDANRQERLNGASVPRHLLLLDHASGQDRIDGRLGEGRRDGLADAVASAVVGQRVRVGSDRTAGH